MLICIGSTLIAIGVYSSQKIISEISGFIAIISACGIVPPLGNTFEINPNSKTIRVNRKTVDLKAVALIEVSPLADAMYVIFITFEDSSWLALCEAAKAEQLTRLANLIRQIITPEPEQTNETSPSQI